MEEKSKNKNQKTKSQSFKFWVKVLVFSLLFVALPVTLNFDTQSSISYNEAQASIWDNLLGYLSNAADITSGQFDGVPEGATETYTDGPGFWKGLIFKLAELIIRSIFFVIYAILWSLYSIVYSLVGASEWVLSIIFDPDFVKSMGGFTQVHFVKKTASLVSNICNIVYLFVLLYIAILSMLGRAETGRWLKKLVIAALLTNFSLVIAGVIIDFSQILMYSFPMGNEGKFQIGTQIIDNIQKNILGSGSGNSTSSGNFITDQLKNISTTVMPSEDSSSFWTVAGAIFLFKMSIGEALSKIIHLSELLIFCIAMMITLITVTSILVVRIVALWIILIVSPAAFLMYSFPPTEKYFSAWLDSLVKYAATGPILIFFLFLAKKISDFIQGSSDGNGVGAYLAKKSSNITDTASLKDDLMVFIAKNFQVTFQFIVLIIVIWAGIIIANKFGIKGSASADQLINKTKRWSKKGLSMAGGAVVATGVLSKMGTWSGFDLANKLRGRKLKSLNASLGENQAQLKNLDPNSAEHKELSATIDSQKSKKEALEGKIKTSAQRKNKFMKAFALTSPSLIKKRFGKYMEDRKKSYSDDVDNNLSDFMNYWVNKSGNKDAAVKNAGRQTAEIENQIRELTTKYRTEKNVEKRKELKDSIEHQLKNLLDIMTDDEDRKKRFLPELMKELETNTNVDVLKKLVSNEEIATNPRITDAERASVQSTLDLLDDAVKKKDRVEYDKQLNILAQELNGLKIKDPALAGEDFMVEAEDMVKKSIASKWMPNDDPPSLTSRFGAEIKKTAEKRSIDYTKGDKLREETSKKIKDRMEELKKDPMINKELLSRQFARDELSQVDREAVLSLFSSSARDMATLVRNVNKETGKSEGDIKNATEFIEQKTSRFSAMRALNNVQADALKSKNLTLIGHTVFDSISGMYRQSTDAERRQALSRPINSMSDKEKFSKINPVVFQFNPAINDFNDKVAVEATLNAIDFKKIIENPKLRGEILEDIPSKTRQSLIQNRRQFGAAIKDTAQRTNLNDFISKHLR